MVAIRVVERESIQDPEPEVLYTLRRMHQPALWQFVRLYPNEQAAKKPPAELTSHDAAGAYCLRCKCKIFFRVGNHSVRKHMVHHHAKELAEFEEMENDDGDGDDEGTDDHCRNDPQGKKRRVREITDDEQEMLDRVIATWIAESMRPLAIVEDPGFRRVIECVAKLGNIGLKIIKRTRVRESIQELAIKQREAVRVRIVEGCESFGMTSDIWTDRSARGFMAVTVHYIDRTFVGHHYTLEVQRFGGSHTGLRISEQLGSDLNKWSLKPEHCTKLTRDSNAVLAASDLGVSDQHCIPHALQRVVSGCLYAKLANEVDEEAQEYINAYDAGDSDDIVQDSINALRISAIVDVHDFVHAHTPKSDRTILAAIRKTVQCFRSIAVYFRKLVKARERLEYIQVKQLGKLPKEVLMVQIDCPT